MEQMAKKRVPVTDEEKQKSYYKYFEQEMAQPSPEAYAKMLNGPLRPDQVLQFKTETVCLSRDIWKRKPAGVFYRTEPDIWQI